MRFLRWGRKDAQGASITWGGGHVWGEQIPDPRPVVMESSLVRRLKVRTKYL